MSQKFVSRGFTGKRERAGGQGARVPPGQHLVSDFPVLSAGPTPRTDLARWTFTIDGLVTAPVSWSWADFKHLPVQDFVKDIWCVTKWTKRERGPRPASREQGRARLLGVARLPHPRRSLEGTALHRRLT